MIPVPSAVGSSSTSGSSLSQASLVKRHRAYFTQNEISYMTEKQRGKLTAKAEDKQRQTACAFAESVGGRLGFPRRTIATAQTLYHRFHLFYALQDFVYHDVILSCLYVACKMHDTLKKPRDIILASYSIRFPEKANKGKGPLGGQGTGIVAEADVDPAILEQDRLKLLSVERLLLETICFNFKVNMPFSYVVKFARALGASKTVAQAAWRISVDSNRTLSPLLYPPHFIALASIYLAALLGSLGDEAHALIDSVDPVGTERQGCVALAEVLGSSGGWEDRFKAKVGDLEAITHSLLDLFIHHLSESPLSLSTHHNHQPSPSSPSDFAPPSTPNNPTASTSQLCTAFPPTLQISDLTQIKISLHAQSAQREGGGEDRAGREIGRKEDPSRGYSLPKGPSAGKTRQKDVWGADVSGKKGNEEGEATRFLFE